MFSENRALNRFFLSKFKVFFISNLIFNKTCLDTNYPKFETFFRSFTGKKFKYLNYKTCRIIIWSQNWNSLTTEINSEFGWLKWKFFVLLSKFYINNNNFGHWFTCLYSQWSNSGFLIAPQVINSCPIVFTSKQMSILCNSHFCFSNSVEHKFFDCYLLFYKLALNLICEWRRTTQDSSAF